MLLVPIIFESEVSLFQREPLFIQPINRAFVAAMQVQMCDSDDNPGSDSPSRGFAIELSLHTYFYSESALHCTFCLSVRAYLSLPLCAPSMGPFTTCPRLAQLLSSVTIHNRYGTLFLCNTDLRGLSHRLFRTTSYCLSSACAIYSDHNSMLRNATTANIQTA